MGRSPVRDHLAGALSPIPLRPGAPWVDLDSCPHLLVGGMTGGGKSVFLRQALTFLCREHGPEDLQLALIDLKGGVELAHFSYLPHAILPVADSLLAAAEALERVRRELDRRLQEVRAAAAGAPPDAPPSWPRLLVVVDEVAERTCRDLGDDRGACAAQQAASGRLCEIARLGPSVGIHLVCCTQRPDAEAVQGPLKANLAGTVAFRVRAAVNSYILLDSDRAALLPPHPGRAIWQEDSTDEVQAVVCSLEKSRGLLLAGWPRRGSSHHECLLNGGWKIHAPVRTTSPIPRDGGAQDPERGGGHHPLLGPGGAVAVGGPAPPRLAEG
jgi:DNA segregation ATPase FtsK/SpoIIIE-like protein